MVQGWSFGMYPDGNLLGTIKSLDELGVETLNCTQNAGQMVHDVCCIARLRQPTLRLCFSLSLFRHTHLSTMPDANNAGVSALRMGHGFSRWLGHDQRYRQLVS